MLTIGHHVEEKLLLQLPPDLRKPESPAFWDENGTAPPSLSYSMLQRISVTLDTVFLGFHTVFL